jgi:hypothetical protein
MKRLWALLALAVFIASCDTTAQMELQPRMRVEVSSPSSGSMQFTAFLEGPDGNALTGAVVLVREPSNRIIPLRFDAESCSYTASAEALSGAVTYVFEAQTILSDKLLCLNVPYTGLTQKPAVTVFRDDTGNSVLSGQNLDSTEPIQIAWTLTGEDAAYIISIKAALQTVYTVSTAAGTVIIPQGSFSPGTYTLEIIAQKIFGDPYFREYSYYSISSINSVALNFDVE